MRFWRYCIWDCTCCSATDRSCRLLNAGGESGHTAVLGQLCVAVLDGDGAAGVGGEADGAEEDRCGPSPRAAGGARGDWLDSGVVAGSSLRMLAAVPPPTHLAQNQFRMGGVSTGGLWQHMWNPTSHQSHVSSTLSSLAVLRAKSRSRSSCSTRS